MYLLDLGWQQVELEQKKYLNSKLNLFHFNVYLFESFGDKNQ